MAQNFAVKQQAWINRFVAANQQFMALADQMKNLCDEFAQETYGTGGANALTDAVVQPVLPAATALQVAQAEGAYAGASAILAVIATNRGYLENMRP